MWASLAPSRVAAGWRVRGHVIHCSAVARAGGREEHSMDPCRSRLKLSENFERHWSIPISGEIHMDQSLVHTFSWGNSYGPMVLKVLQKFPPTLVVVHGWLFPGRAWNRRSRRLGGGCPGGFVGESGCTARAALMSSSPSWKASGSKKPGDTFT